MAITARQSLATTIKRDLVWIHMNLVIKLEPRTIRPIRFRDKQALVMPLCIDELRGCHLKLRVAFRRESSYGTVYHLTLSPGLRFGVAIDAKRIVRRIE